MKDVTISVSEPYTLAKVAIPEFHQVLNNLISREDYSVELREPYEDEFIARHPDKKEDWENKNYEKNRVDKHELMNVFYTEIARCISYAQQVKDGYATIYISPEFRIAGTQAILEFTVNSSALPKGDSYNFHGQNTSQWVYAGAIVVEGGKVSTHH